MVVAVGGAHGHRVGDPRRGRVAGVDAVAAGVAVAGGDREAHAVGDRLPDRSVERGTRRATQTQVGDGRLARPVVGSDPFDAGDDRGRRPLATAVEDANGDQAHALGHPVGRAADGARHVGAVAVAIGGLSTVDGVEPADGATAELVVAQPDPGVDDVGGHTVAGGGVVVVAVERQRRLVEAVEAPGGLTLDAVGVHRPVGPEPDAAVGLDLRDAGVGPHGLDARGRDDSGVALQRPPVDVGDACAVTAGVVGGDRVGVGDGVLQLHDVATRRGGGVGGGGDPGKGDNGDDKDGRRERGRDGRTTKKAGHGNLLQRGRTRQGEAGPEG